MIIGSILPILGVMQPMGISNSWQGYQNIAKDYEKGRPDYPHEAVSILASALKLESGMQVLDLAAGTGKLTKALEYTKVHLCSVEPVSSMREVFHERIPNIPILDGQAEEIPLSSESMDAVVVGTAFHWFNGEKALEEIARVLKPGGGLGLIWNIFDEDVDWVKELRALWQVGEGQNLHDRLLWKPAFAHTSLFTSLQHETVRYTFPGTEQDVLDRLYSAKFFGGLPETEQQDLVEKTLQFLSSHPATKGKTVLQIPYRAEIYWCHRK